MTLTVTLDRPAHRAPRIPGKLRRALGITLQTVLSVSSAAVTPHKASLTKLWDMPLSVLGVSGIDFASFHIAHGWGWLVTGVSLIVLEHLIADADGQQ